MYMYIVILVKQVYLRSQVSVYRTIGPLVLFLPFNLIFKIPEVVEFLRFFFQSLVICIMIYNRYSFRYIILWACVLPLFLKYKKKTVINFWYPTKNNNTDAKKSCHITACSTASVLVRRYDQLDLYVAQSIMLIIISFCLY